MDKFKDLGLSERIAGVIRELNFKEPSGIQKSTIPIILKGKDLIGNAATGSGKTLAFASGIIEKITPKQGIQALVLTPTRELAEQVSNAIKTFSRKTSLTTQEVYGGVPIGSQIRGLKNSEIVVGTPGRILDHMHRETISLSKIKVLVLDEADRMVDMGFLPDVEKIITQCPQKKQTLLFSATNSQDVEHIAKKYMRKPAHISVEQYVDPLNLKQYFYDTPQSLKFSLLVHLLKKEDSGIVMVFCNTRDNVDFLAMNLKRHNIPARAIHGGFEQKKRSRIMEQFHSNQANILICTDVAARGLDIKGVTHVYNYDIPANPKEYIHRIGRTARAGEKGMAVSIVSNRDYNGFNKVLKETQFDIKQKPLPYVEKLMPNFQKKNNKSRTSKPPFLKKGRNRRSQNKNHKKNPHRKHGKR